MNPNYVVYDIETVANEASKAYFQAKHYDAPKNWKDPAKIEQYVLEARHEDMMKAALKWWTGQVVCISAQSLTAAFKPKTFMGPDEKGVLKAFFDFVTELEQPVLIGKNGDAFDRPFLIGRLLAHDLGIPRVLRPYRSIEDINHIFGFSSRCDQIGRLSDYAFGLAIDAKTGHGTDVQNWFNQTLLGETTAWDKIGSYCAQDVHITAEMLRRWLKEYPLPKTAEQALPRAQAPAPALDIPFGPTEAGGPAPAPTQAMQPIKRMEF